MNVLAIGAHPDDIEIGCGATLVEHVARGDAVTMLVVTDGALGPGNISARRDEQEKAANVLKVTELLWGGLPDCLVDNHRLDLVHIIERAITAGSIDRLYTHFVLDSHQDHEAVAKTTLGAGRHCSQILQYGAPSSYDFNPPVFIDVSSSLDVKLEALKCHASQMTASEMVDVERVRSTARATGHLARCDFAEGFIPYRLTLDL